MDTLREPFSKTLVLFLLIGISPHASAQEGNHTPPPGAAQKSPPNLIDQPLMSLKPEFAEMVHSEVYLRSRTHPTLDQIAAELETEPNWSTMRPANRRYFLSIHLPLIVSAVLAEKDGEELVDWKSFLSDTSWPPAMQSMDLEAWREAHGEMTLRTLMTAISQKYTRGSVGEGPLGHALAGKDFANSIGMVMIAVQPGKVGPIQTREPDEFKSIQIEEPYFLARTEVTHAQWQAVMGDNPETFSEANSTAKNFPVENVSWDEAMAFCKRLTEQDRAAGKLPAGYIYSLPTEEQWEYACRAGTTSDYAGPLTEMAWYFWDNSEAGTNPVGTKNANAWGFHDMHGNVWEWCLNNYGTGRSNRGGGWRDDAMDCRSGSRYEGAPDTRSPHIGFRPALIKAAEPE